MNGVCESCGQYGTLDEGFVDPTCPRCAARPYGGVGGAVYLHHSPAPTHRLRPVVESHPAFDLSPPDDTP